MKIFLNWPCFGRNYLYSQNAAYLLTFIKKENERKIKFSWAFHLATTFNFRFRTKPITKTILIPIAIFCFVFSPKTIVRNNGTLLIMMKMKPVKKNKNGEKAVKYEKHYVVNDLGSSALFMNLSLLSVMVFPRMIISIKFDFFLFHWKLYKPLFKHIFKIFKYY